MIKHSIECDKCGKDVVQGWRLEKRFMDSPISQRAPSGIDRRSYELCSDCMTEFTNWLVA